MKDPMAILGWISLGLQGLIAIFILIPGDQPEKFLQKIVDIIESISRKKP